MKSIRPNGTYVTSFVQSGGVEFGGLLCSAYIPQFLGLAECELIFVDCIFEVA